MADHYSQEAPAPASPAVQRDGSSEHAKLRRTVRSFLCTGQASGDRLILDNVPVGARGVHHRVTVSATLGTSTLEIGTASAPAHYAAAAAYTAANTPVDHVNAADLEATLAADEQQYATIGTAALPNDNTVIAVETFFTMAD